MATRDGYSLEPDLRNGVVPISKAASSLAALLKQAAQTRRPIVVTQKGRPQAVLLSVEFYNLLRELAAEQPTASEDAG